MVLCVVFAGIAVNRAAPDESASLFALGFAGRPLARILTAGASIGGRLIFLEIPLALTIPVFSAGKVPSMRTHLSSVASRRHADDTAEIIVQVTLAAEAYRQRNVDQGHVRQR